MPSASSQSDTAVQVHVLHDVARKEAMVDAQDESGSYLRVSCLQEDPRAILLRIPGQQLRQTT